MTNSHVPSKTLAEPGEPDPDPSGPRPDGLRERPSLARRLARDHGDSPAELLAETRFMLAQALWDAPPQRGRDRARALILADEARAGLVELGAARADDVVEIERWISERAER
jgi:hypothetical protein